MTRKISLNDFKFMPSGYGHYKVTYTSPITGKSWTATSSDMPLIDLTKGEEYPKQKFLNQLKRFVKLLGKKND